MIYDCEGWIKNASSCLVKCPICDANGLAICCVNNIGLINVYNGFTWLQNTTRIPIYSRKFHNKI